MILIWGMLLFVIATILDIMVSVGLQRSGIRKYVVWSDILHRRIDADVVIIGSSRAWCSYNTFILDSLLECNSYNLGIDGHQLDMQLIRYETYRRYSPAPKVILINTDFCSTLGITADERYEREQFFPFVKDRVLIRQISQAKHISVLERIIPFLRYFGYRDELDDGIAAIFGKVDFPESGFHKGYKGYQYAWNRGPILDLDTLITISINPSLIDRLDSFVSKAKSEGIDVYLIKSPIYAPILNHFNNVSATDSVFIQISRKNSAPILDFYRADYCYDTSYFYNPSHLNKDGSIIFTTDLCQQLSALNEGIFTYKP